MFLSFELLLPFYLLLYLSPQGLRSALIKRLFRQFFVLFTTHYLDEAEANANRIAIIDHGKLLVIGTAAQLMKQTKTNTLEKAYLELTGKELRDEEVSPHEVWRSRQRSRNMR